MCRCNTSRGRSDGACFPARSSVLPIKLNSAGFLVPTTVAPWIIFLPLAAATFGLGQTPWLAAAYEQMQFGRTAHIMLGAVLVFVLAFIYTAYVLDPERAAETLQRTGRSDPRRRSGRTDRRPSRSRGDADHRDRRRLARGNIFPARSLGRRRSAAPYKIGGGSALIVVCTILDIRTQVRDLRRAGRGGERR